METLPEDKMPEAEVSLRLALHIARNGYTTGDVDVGIDGAQVRNLMAIQFPMDAFLAGEGLTRVGSSGNSWQGVYELPGSPSRLNIHSIPGRADVVAELSNGRRIWVESKKGNLQRTPSSPEYKLIREAIGQIMTTSQLSDTDLLAIAVPHSDKHVELCDRWITAPLIRRIGISFIRVHRNGQVEGLPEI